MPLEIIWILGVITVWRLSSLMTYEKGPWDIFIRIRRKAGIVHDDQNCPMEWPDTFFAGVLSCLWCNSIWIAFFWVMAYYLLGDITVFVSLIFSISAGAIGFNKVIRG